MTRSATGKQVKSEEHSHLTISVDRYEASVSARINHFAYEPQYAWHPIDEEPVYQFSNGLIVWGIVTWPEDRGGDRCEVTLYGDVSPARDLDTRLEEIAELDEDRLPRYRKYRGREVPVYREPKGFGVLDKVRGEPEWRTSLFVKPTFVDRWLALLTSSDGLFISLHECKSSRKRWVRGIELRTSDPNEG